MMITSWRMTKARHASTAFDGEGAKNYGGRWNKKGTPLIYTAGSKSLAALEMLVHIEAVAVLDLYVYIPVSFDDSLCVQISEKDLPLDWKLDPVPASTQMLGTMWAIRKASLVLVVPSVIVDTEFNYIINPLHPDFSKLKYGDPVTYAFDQRILK